MNTSPILTSLEERALELLSSGVSQAQCASALGVSESRISQLLSEDVFAAQLAERRFSSLQKHNARDAELDAMEDQIISQMKGSISMVMQPEKLARMLQIVNAAKRRGSASPDAIHEKQTVIKLSMPTMILQKFQTNIANQVVAVDGQSLVTVQSDRMKKMLARISNEPENKPDSFGFTYAPPDGT